MVAGCSRRRGEESRTKKFSELGKVRQKRNLYKFIGLERQGKRRLEEYTSFLFGASIRFIAYQTGKEIENGRNSF